MWVRMLDSAGAFGAERPLYRSSRRAFDAKGMTRPVSAIGNVSQYQRLQFTPQQPPNFMGAFSRSRRQQ
ncbi:protein of unknown function [Paraburkholderia kururiensis]